MSKISNKYFANGLIFNTGNVKPKKEKKINYKTMKEVNLQPEF